MLYLHPSRVATSVNTSAEETQTVRQKPRAATSVLHWAQMASRKQMMWAGGHRAGCSKIVKMELPNSLAGSVLLLCTDYFQKTCANVLRETPVWIRVLQWKISWTCFKSTAHVREDDSCYMCPCSPCPGRGLPFFLGTEICASSFPWWQTAWISVVGALNPPASKSTPLQAGRLAATFIIFLTSIGNTNWGICCICCFLFLKLICSFKSGHLVFLLLYPSKWCWVCLTRRPLLAYCCPGGAEYFPAKNESGEIHGFCYPKWAVCYSQIKIVCLLQAEGRDRNGKQRN